MSDDAHPGVPLREYIEALMDAHQRAEEIAERERSRAAGVLAEGLERSIIAGDLALRDHILQQVRQIEAALTSVDRRMEALHEEMVLRDVAGRDLLFAEGKSNDIRVREAFEASEKAISKAEVATDKRFDGVNAFREQLADQVQQFLPREVAESQIAEVRKQIAANTTRLDLTQGTSQGSTASIAQVMAIVTILIALLAIGIGAYT